MRADAADDAEDKDLDDSVGHVRAWLFAALLALGLALLLTAQLGAAPVGSRAEQRCDDIVRAMHASGDWLVPRREGAAWLNKPPLFYWLATSVGALRGQVDRFGLRSVSALAALGVLLLTLLWARRRGAVEALLAGALFTCMVEVIARGREGTAEMTLCLLANLCLFLFAEREFHARAGLRWCFALALGAALLAKATSALLIVGLPIGVSLLSRGRGAQLLRRRHVVPVVTALLLGVSWHVVVSLTTPGAFATFTSALLLPLGVVTEQQSVLHSATHYGAWYLPIDSLLRGAAPVSLLLPLVVVRAWRSRFWQQNATLRFHAIVVISLLTAFVLLPQKRPHYVLPCFPSLALLTADACFAAARRSARFVRRARISLGVAQLALFALLGVSAAFWFGVVLEVERADLFALAAGLAALLAVVVFALRSGRTSRVAVGALLVWWALLAFHAGSVQVWRERSRSGEIAASADAESARWADLLQRYPRLLGAFEPDRAALAQPPGNARDELASATPDIGASPTSQLAAGSFVHSLSVETPP